MEQIKLGKEWKIIIRKYELLDYIGKGAFGEVIKARHL